MKTQKITRLIFRLFILLLTSSTTTFSQHKTSSLASNDEIDSILNQWHNAAAIADYDTYFGLMTKDAVFIGTDPTENWQNEAFRIYSKPHFDKGKAWKFTALDRNIYISDTKNLAWFDELLDTQMGICRGSGIIQKGPFGWKIKHYVLSMTIPNANVKEVKELKTTFDTHLKTRIKE